MRFSLNRVRKKVLSGMVMKGGEETFVIPTSPSPFPMERGTEGVRRYANRCEFSHQ
jgi:hypothetical protein